MDIACNFNIRKCKIIDLIPDIIFSFNNSIKGPFFHTRNKFIVNGKLELEMQRMFDNRPTPMSYRRRKFKKEFASNYLVYLHDENGLFGSGGGRMSKIKVIEIPTRRILIEKRLHF